jgi:5-methyltetrahydrofolate--homocysteine methyltransferase
MSDLLSRLHERALILDGAMGTNIHRKDPTDADWGGKDLVNCTEWILMTHPDWIRDIHRDFFAVGCDAVETNTFGANAIALGEFNKVEYLEEINRRAVRVAKEARDEFSTPDWPRYVIGSVGPGTKPVSFTDNTITFDQVVEAYQDQMRIFLQDGVDAILLETAFDILHLKALVVAAREQMHKVGRQVPLMAQVTIESFGTMLAGTDIAAALVTLEALPVDVIGMNCATGPDMMLDHLLHLSKHCRRFISCLPNAGIPETVDGKAHFHLQPHELARALRQFVAEFGVNIVGGCCGTTPEHLKAVVEAVRGVQPKVRTPIVEPSVASLTQAVTLKMVPGPLIVGERTNTTGSRKFKKLLEADDLDGMVDMAREQEDEGAHLLDVCLAYPGRDEVADMTAALRRINKVIKLPVVIDSTEWQVMEAGLKCVAGKPFLNSINLEEGRTKLDIVVPFAKKYGAALVALTIDEEGQATTCDWKFRVAQRIYDICVNEYGVEPTDLYFDPLVLPVSTGQPELYNAAVETLNSIRRIKAELPGAGTWLGLSNISFGLDPYVRQVVNSVFLKLGLEAGLDAAILNASKILPLNEIDPTGLKLAERLLLNQRDAGDPLQQLIAHYQAMSADGKKTTAKKTVHLGDTVEERLKNAIIQGRRDSLIADLDQARTRYAPLEIINTILLDGMKVVGDLFGSGQMQLPFVLQSAEVMKLAVKHLEQFMERVEGAEKGKIVLATVKGDVHDIGKNLVDIILTNNGYKVYNLGIKQPVETILEAAEKHRAHAIGMSGLLVKSTVIMKENLELMQRRGLNLPVICGGAALTRKYVEHTLSQVYEGPVFYGEDAFEGLRVMDELCQHGVERVPAKPRARAAGRADDVGAAAVAVLDAPPAPGSSHDANGARPTPPRGPSRRTLPPADDLPTPPWLGTRVVTDLDMTRIFPYLNQRTLFSTQWQFRKNNVAPADYERQIEKVALPTLERLKTQCLQENILRPAVVYGFFPCASDGDDLIIFHDDRRTERLRFTFPRQAFGDSWCISDFFQPLGEAFAATDHIAMMAVTMGEAVSIRTKELFEDNKYTDYLYLHGLGVECAEALAEYWHQRIRQEWGIAGDDSPDIQKLFKLHYRGCRYSFGYPACPDLEDQTKLFELLQPDRIGLHLTEQFLLEPEQSTNAIIVHHPAAKYFNVKCA